MTELRRLRLAAHIHSAWSDDSDWSLDRLAKTLRRAGFDGALVCDHDRTMTERRRRRMVEECGRVTEQGFVMIPGVEYQDPDHVVHIPVYGDIPFMGSSPVVSDLLPRVHEAGGVSVFAHPIRRNANLCFDPAWARWLTGIEVWNRKYDGIAPNRWAIEFARKQGLQYWVGLDFHGPRQLFPLALLVAAPSTGGAESIMNSIREGRSVATAFGERVDELRFGKIAQQAERVRRRLAPTIRRAERSLVECAASVRQRIR